MNSVVAFAVVLAIILGGAAIGAFLRRTLPGHHLTEDTKDVMRLGSGLIGWMAALVLGLLIASANNTYETQSNQIKSITAGLILLDQLLELYGPEAQDARVALRAAIVPLAERIWQTQGSARAGKSPFEKSPTGEAVFAKVQALSPQNDNQRLLKTRAIELGTEIIQTRVLLFEQSQHAIPLPFLAVLVLWLAIIFATYSLFSRPNPTLIAAMFVFAFSASSAIFLIVELSQPFSGLMQIPMAPLLSALAPLGS